MQQLNELRAKVGTEPDRQLACRWIARRTMGQIKQRLDTFSQAGSPGPTSGPWTSLGLKDSKVRAGMGPLWAEFAHLPDAEGHLRVVGARDNQLLSQAITLPEFLRTSSASLYATRAI